MAQEEVYGTRERTYSAWHRRMSTGRFVGIEAAQTLAMIDLDAALYVECEDKVWEPLALIETARDVGQRYKTASVTQNLSKRTNPTVPAYCLLYTPSNEPNPASPEHPDILKFRVKRLWPNPETNWREISPEQWCRGLCELREWSAKRLDSYLGLAPAA